MRRSVTIQVVVFWVVMPCSVVVGYHCFGRPCCLHFKGEDSFISLWNQRQHGPLKCLYPTTSLHYVTTQKTSTWIFIIVLVWNLCLWSTKIFLMLSQGLFPWGIKCMQQTTHLHLVPRSRNTRSYTSVPPIRLHDLVLSWAQGQFYFYFTFYL